MDIDLGYQSLDDPNTIASPTVDVREEAARKLAAGEISMGTFYETINKLNEIDNRTAAGIAEANRAIDEKYSYWELYGKPLAAAGGALSDTIKNLIFLGLVVLLIYALSAVKRLEA